MTDIYVDSGAAGPTHDGSTKAFAYLTLAAALADANIAGANVWVSKGHAETPQAASMALTFPTATASRVKVASVDFAGSTPPAAADLSSGAVVATSTASSYNLALTGSFESRGVTYAAYNVQVGTVSIGVDAIFDPNTVLRASITNNVNGTITFGALVTQVVYRVDLNGARIEHALNTAGTANICTVANCNLTWRKGSVTGANNVALSTVPTFNLFVVKGNSSISLEGVDLSGLTDSKRYLFGTASNSTFKADLKDCKLPASYGGVLPSGYTLTAGSRVRLIRCGSAAGAFGQQTYAPEGYAVDETSLILPGGLSDGVTAKSRRLVVSGASAVSPFADNAGVIWNAQTGSQITATVEVLAPTGTTNGDLWLEVEGLVDTSDPLGDFGTSGRATPLDAATVLPTSTAAWQNVPNGLTAYKLVAPITPRQAGPLTLRVKSSASAATTFYVDGKPVISGAPTPVSRASLGPEGTLIHETGAVTQGPSVNVYVPVPGRRFSR